MSGAWAVEIRKYRDRMVWAFPYNLPIGIMPPFPGFTVLEYWLIKNHPKSTFERLYNDGDPALEIKFEDEHSAFMFVLAAGAPKQ